MTFILIIIILILFLLIYSSCKISSNISKNEDYLEKEEFY